MEQGADLTLDAFATVLSRDLQAGKTENARWFLDHATPAQREDMRVRLRELRARG